MRLRLLAALAVVFASATAAPALATSPSPTIAANTAVATLRAENAAFNRGDARALWTAYTPKYKSKCGPYAKFARNIGALRKQLGGVALKTRITNVRITGAKAFLAYQLLAGGKVVQTVKPSSPDVYIQVGGLWYDEYEPAHGC